MGSSSGYVLASIFDSQVSLVALVLLEGQGDDRPIKPGAVLLASSCRRFLFLVEIFMVCL